MHSHPINSVSHHGSRHRPPWLRHCAFATSALFLWSFALAAPAQALTHQPPARRLSIRTLSPTEMQHLVGQVGGGPPFTASPGASYPWEGSYGGVNTGNGNKLTTISLFSWTQIGGLPVNLTLYHNSESSYDQELGQKWTSSFDIYLVANGTNQTINWGNGQSYTFTNNAGVFSPPTGIHDSLVQNVDGTFTLTIPAQIAYHFTGGYCDTIQDENNNTITLTRNPITHFVTQVQDATHRMISFNYDANNRIQAMTVDGLNWTLSYDASNQLQSLTLTNAGVGYSYTFGYDTNHNITDLKNPNGNHATFNYNSDNSLNWQKDPAGNQTSFSYSSPSTTITDPNGHTRVDTYSTTAGTLSSIEDGMSKTESYLYDANLNRTQVTDRRGKLWKFQFDSNGNVILATDPLNDKTQLDWSSHNKLLYVIVPTGEETDYGYDPHDNLTSISHKDANGIVQATETFMVNGNGLRTDYFDANNHHYQYGYDGNGCLSSVTTPLGHMTHFTADGFGFRTSRTDALMSGRTTYYTPDALERLWTITYPDQSTKTFYYDADNDLTQFVDVTGTTNLSYDVDDRLTKETKGLGGGTIIVQHRYDAAGKLGLLSTTTDANGRVMTYSWDAGNRLSKVAESSGTTSYGYDGNDDETSVTNENGTKVVEGYDTASQLTSVVNKTSSATVLSSFSYVLDTDGRRKSCTEADGSVVSYGYDWGSRLTSETRTGTNPYTESYVLDPVGNRTSQTIGTATTSFTLDSDDELTAASSTTGGLNNSYGYDANGEQTSRTIGGTASTLSYDYDGELTSIVQGTNTTSFQYDALGRRMNRTAGGVATNFLDDGNQVLLEQQGGSTTATYTYGNALVRKDGEYPLFDGLGSERTVTNSSQAVQGTVTYDGFGQTVATSGSSTDPYMFAATSGYRNDGDAGLMLVGARYYDAQVGRFITRDTDLSQHPYLYCNSDPVNHLDPTGHWVDAGTVGGWLGTVGGGVIGGIIGGPPGAMIGGGIGSVIGGWIGDKLIDHKSNDETIDDGLWNFGTGMLGGIPLVKIVQPNVTLIIFRIVIFK